MRKKKPKPPNAGCRIQSFVRVLIKPYMLGSEFIKTIFFKNTGCFIICVTIFTCFDDVNDFRFLYYYTKHHSISCNI